MLFLKLKNILVVLRNTRLVRVSIIGDYVEFIYCGCGCGFTTAKYYKEGNKYRKSRIKRFVPGHQPFLLKGRILKEKAYQWKGDNVSYGALHDWVKKYNPKPERCQICNEIKKLDLANKTGIYNRDFKNWFYLCRECHIKYDDIIERDPKTGKYRNKKKD